MNTPDLCRALSADERHIARGIVERKYLAQGYAISDDIARYLEMPQATTYGLFHDDALYGTISIIVDSEQGLPMDSIYSDELASWRASGKNLAEVVQFAVDREVTDKKPSPFEAAPLFGAVLAHALREKIDHLCISINPKHDRFYALLGFTQIGGEKHYGAVGAPAIARVLSVRDATNNPLIASFMKN